MGARLGGERGEYLEARCCIDGLSPAVASRIDAEARCRDNDLPFVGRKRREKKKLLRINWHTAGGQRSGWRSSRQAAQHADIPLR